MFRDWTLSREKLILSSSILVIIGGYFFYQVSQLAAEVSLEVGGQWTGIITIYVFFSQLLTIGFIVAVILQLKQTSKTTIAICLIGLIFYFDRIVMHGRRSSMIELFLIVTLSLWFKKGFSAPRWLIVLIVGIGVLVVNSIGDYRSTMLEKDRTSWTGAGVDQILEIDFIGNLKQSFQEGGYDVVNAVYLIDQVDRDLDFDFGASFYNSWVVRYVPAQIVGKDIKNAMLLDFVSDPHSVLGNNFRTGTTLTGFAEVFRSFWYFGAAIFYLIGMIASKFYRASLNQETHSQIIFLLIAYPALLVFPFHGQSVFL